MKLIIILLIIGVYARIILSQKSFSSLLCLKNKRESRIIGGSDTLIGEIPFIVSLTRRGGHFCGATILNDKWLVTAGHCVCNGLDKIIKSAYIKGFLGLHKLSDINRNNLFHNFEVSLQIDLKRIIVHPNYVCSQPSDDIALLEVVKPINFSGNIKPACIAADAKETYENTFGTVFGWGWTNENREIGENSNILQKANIKIWNNENCQNSYKRNGKKNIIKPTQMCAGYEEGGIDSCWADSGGPLLNENNVLIGIVSTGIGCARPGLPGIYTRVSEYTKWIESVILS